MRVGRCGIHRLQRGHTKVEYMKASIGSDDFWFCGLLSGCCEESQEWIRFTCF